MRTETEIQNALKRTRLPAITSVEHPAAQTYADGVQAGCNMTLRWLLGEEPEEAGKPETINRLFDE